MYPQYMCILLYVIVIWCNGISEIYCQLEWGVDVSSVYMHFAISELIWYNVIPYIYCQLVWVGWGMMYPQYMCIL